MMAKLSERIPTYEESLEHDYYTTAYKPSANISVEAITLNKTGDKQMSKLRTVNYHVRSSIGLYIMVPDSPHLLLLGHTDRRSLTRSLLS